MITVLLSASVVWCVIAIILLLRLCHILTAETKSLHHKIKLQVGHFNRDFRLMYITIAKLEDKKGA